MESAASLMRHVRLLPLLVVVATLSFAVRVGEVATGMRQLSGAAFAEEKADVTSAAKEEAAKPETKKEETAAAKEKPADAKPADKAGEKTAEKPAEKTASKWQDAGDSDLEYSDVRTELFEDLAKRRKELDVRDKDLMRREALIKAAEQELDQKFQELTALRKQIEGLLNKQGDEENGRMQSLVKIYEGMKPSDAARIFNTLDLDILMDVIGRMSERKSALILAAMEADRARTITIMLAEQKKLPSLPPQ